jgi:hypothetical protein
MVINETLCLVTEDTALGKRPHHLLTYFCFGEKRMMMMIQCVPSLSQKEKFSQPSIEVPMEASQ